jgi:hypothetical protein
MPIGTSLSEINSVSCPPCISPTGELRSRLVPWRQKARKRFGFNGSRSVSKFAYQICCVVDNLHDVLTQNALADKSKYSKTSGTIQAQSYGSILFLQVA